ncbi:AEC family transporter [Fodinicurvata sediminis]|uniref:AEC family transporter n=1 Tax=Fodinicurvata sediminis TaxID=1121832 RepID=UPI0003B3317D|nr:AEC family transporter [Fodinicurvata sediminis]
MLDIILVIIPIFLLIFLGHVLRKKQFPGDGFWEPAERLTYYVFFPALLISSLAQADFTEVEAAPMIGVLALSIGLMSLAALGLKRLLRIDGPSFSSLYQSVIRFNTYIGFSVAAAYYGAPGMTAAALVVAFLAPLVNILTVVALARYGKAGRPGFLRITKQVLTNPLILGCLVGLALNLTSLGLPPVIGPFLEIMGQASLPIGLLCVGASLRLRALSSAGSLALGAAGLKLFLLPLLTYGILQAWSITGITAAIPILFNALPAAPVSYIMARHLGGNAELMAGLITLHTLLSMATVPIVLSLLA